jgi:hypothetical protein
MVHVVMLRFADRPPDADFASAHSRNQHNIHDADAAARAMELITVTYRL